VDRLIVSGTHEATCGLADATPQATRFSIPKSRKPRDPENSQARDQSFFVFDELPVPAATDTLYGGGIFLRMRKNLRCATQNSASAKAGNRVSTNNGALESRTRDTRKAGQQESGKAVNRKGRVAIPSSSTHRRQSWEASFRTGHRTGHHRSIACPNRLTGSLYPGSGLPNPLPVPTSTVVTFTCSSRTRSTRLIA
jgi:hypothetical protein